ncbi:MAG: polysaccharide biosynthesis/export family protein [Methylobacter sp.]|uniref:polysaccharide biosynthesis/export family protein n=1 Tax=Methylobacter sp. TaxID=2051955 RepID=UPI0027305E9B|nr:polysaccharide biosynthesis/export family protein [Methylobacter sp.]MDP1665726.1 polysaccharide biosynthesis/export family protein [Methylobacter sp.]
MSQYRIKFFSLPSLLLCSVFFYPSLCAAKENNTQQAQNQDSASLNREYRLGSGDLLKITVFNQEDLSGEYTINGAGQISLPLIGDVNAKDLTVKQVEQGIADKLKPDYLLNPRVSAQVLNYRPFYILGEVKEPKSYPYVDGMTYLNAVAIAGGYTYRAKEDYVVVIHMNDPEKRELTLNMDEKVLPGDVIHIKERYF